MAGVGKLFALRAALEKILKPRVALIGKASKKGHHDRRCPINYSKSSEEQKKRSSRPQMSYIALDISSKQSLYFCKSPQAVEMVSRAVVWPPLSYGILVKFLKFQAIAHKTLQ